MNELFEIEKHSEKFGCRLNNLKLVREKQKGLFSTIFSKCRMCGLLFDVNAGAVSEAIVIGTGLSIPNELNTLMNLPSMPFQLFIKK